jgi:hypothetical protein
VAPGDGVENALELEVHVGAEIFLDVGALGFDGDAAVGFAVVGMLEGHGVLGAGGARREPRKEDGQCKGAGGVKRRRVLH